MDMNFHTKKADATEQQTASFLPNGGLQTQLQKF
jgi:hypothetical protein